MKEIGTVKALKGKNAEIEIKRNTACGDCGACHVSKDQSVMLTTANNPIKAKIGETVEVEMEFANVFVAAFIMYGIPLVAFVLGSSGVYFLVGALNIGWDQVVSSFLAGICLTAVAYVVIRKLDRKGRFNSKYQPIVTAIIEKKETIKTPMESRMGH
ncbi:SoxR reducing system RseC family protein [Acetobacterium woodii]|uniref:Putative sigma E factor regulator n=1 Tax=Acetobacterium woodii (strain ATCC 29683 / DSM 1030 / JCM 2381 / KCTC 1655 / WB1) TaxID=931626 RepID=H6LC00_ACEWD|nr:SoxR reducing system RseC family protein [Acetobacterium woodii]AFA48948.1 putative sigma E factor regulator [Acetobacterium woodii DSM 1030]